MMKIMLDLDESVITNMQGYAEQQQTSINELITTLFNRHVQKPATIIDENNGKEINKFAVTLTSYLNESILDIEALVGTEEEHKSDREMVAVYQRLNQKHVVKADVLTDLFQVFKENQK